MSGGHNVPDGPATCNIIETQKHSICPNNDQLNNLHVQIVRLTECYRFKWVFKMQFTDSELSSDKTFCKGISVIIDVSHCKWMFLHDCYGYSFHSCNSMEFQMVQ